MCRTWISWSLHAHHSLYRLDSIEFEFSFLRKGTGRTVIIFVVANLFGIDENFLKSCWSRASRQTIYVASFFIFWPDRLYHLCLFFFILSRFLSEMKIDVENSFVQWQTLQNGDASVLSPVIGNTDFYLFHNRLQAALSWFHNHTRFAWRVLFLYFCILYVYEL